MKLEKFKEKDHKRLGIIVFTIVCILLVSGVILYRTFAIFEVKTNQNVIKGTVQDPGNIYFAFYVDDKIEKKMPQKDTGYIFDEESSYCGIAGSNDENITLEFDKNRWSVTVLGLQDSRTKCNLYFKKSYDTEKLYDLSGNHYDGTFMNGAVVQKDGEENYGIYFDGENDYVDIADLPASINWEDGFTVEFEATWQSLNNWSRILDFGDTNITDNIVIANLRLTNELRVDVRYNGIYHDFSTTSAVDVNKKNHYKFEAIKNPTNYNLKIIKNGQDLNSSIKETTAYIRNVNRTENYLGKSFSSDDGYFHGYIYLLKITDAKGQIILWYEF